MTDFPYANDWKLLKKFEFIPLSRLDYLVHAIKLYTQSTIM